MSANITFEQLRDTLERIESPLRGGERFTYWVLPRKLGIAKTADSAFEIFIVGPRLHPLTSTVRRHLEHARWEIAESGEQLDANRVVLPPGTHFASISALIAIELVRAGIDENRPLQQVMDDVEPIIELALRRRALSEEHVVGLVGELLCLETMLDAIVDRPELRMSVLDMWQGHRVGGRDFVIGDTAIEIKTTYQEHSSHMISGLHQVELWSASDEAVRQLFLLSVGLAENEHEGQTLPEIVGRVLERLGETPGSGCVLTPLQQRFVRDVASYGATDSSGYDHQSMAGWKVYAARFRSTFTPRLYDLLDEDVRILRRRDLTSTHVSSEDIQYRVNLPAAINGFNPAQSWRHVVVDVVKSALSI
ncbi:PD-(D/E)XK motif protein [Cupriavidus pauculus]|uniref:PD-(D/E)XK motif protein n=1 Tax=Cupriavidus pauculus TaxID=82633 RepID=A0A3G8GYJ6_9BURK|nr:PD-(D/E)XK motif protein [Cupriavidus pauculus]AZG13248.1 PD-(D/E)XK motif protein [Cupriavidus pauculus]